MWPVVIFINNYIMPPADKKDNFSDLFNFFSLPNIIRVTGTVCVAFCVVWLNNTYVRNDSFQALETRVSVVENRSLSTEKQMNDLSPTLKSIEKRLSIIITEDGKIIYDAKITGMEKDISLIQRDIEYIKETIKDNKRTQIINDRLISDKMLGDTNSNK